MAVSAWHGIPFAHYAKRVLMIDHELGDEGFHLQRFIDMKETA
jgi:hypothetical protein